MNFILLLTAVFICLEVKICSRASNDVNTVFDMSRLFFGSLIKPKQKSARKSRLRTVPSYMRKLFKQQNPKTSVFSEVSCIFNQDYSPPSVKHQLLTFDLSSHVTKLQSASRVQLRVFKRRSKLRDAKDLFFIHLYEVNPSTESNFSVEYQKIVSSRLVDNLHGQWLTFDVTSLVEKNTLDSTSKNFLVDVKPVSSHTTSRSVSIAKVGRKRPMLLLFYKKNLSNNEKKTKLTKMRMFSLKMARFPRDARATEGAGEYCRRHRLYIDFRVIGWSDRIIAPRGFPAYYCHGKCSMMLSQSMNPSHHSFILNLYKLFAQDDNIPSAYCVPTELKSTSLLYFDEQQNIVLKEVPDMTVTSCGCR